MGAEGFPACLRYARQKRNIYCGLAKALLAGNPLKFICNLLMGGIGLEPMTFAV